ncbi:hypothetical protein AAFF_G00440590 [Aldrovandia affinis]|uniref:Ig-like domain-containing protein n=1 Tax=Aldrovandia affinis TaxID=143900 RepID=A0AAD7S761_9TELE|nr:hypothetical protein AAFF_G00440590 [Aldrovandia affinis]
MAFQKNAFIFAGLYTFLATWPAWASVDVTMKDRVEASIGGKAEILCRYAFSGVPSVVIVQWFVAEKDSGRRRRIFYSNNATDVVDSGTGFTDRLNISRSSAGGDASGPGPSEDILLTVEGVRLGDEGEFICQVSGMSAGNEEGRTQLRVFDSPEPPVIEGVHSGISVNEEDPSKIAVCEARNGYPKPNITWYRDLTPLVIVKGQVNIRERVTKESSGLFTVESELQLKVSKEDKDAHFYCEVNYFVPNAVKMTESQRVNITVYYPATSVWLHRDSPDGLVKEGDTVEIQCQSDGYPQPIFAFSRENQEEDLPSEVNLLVLRDVTRSHSGTYLCRSLDLDTYEEIVGTLDLQVHHLDRAVVHPKHAVVAQGDGVTVTCNAQSSLNTNTTWFKDGAEVSVGHTLVLQNASFDTAGEYVCEVTVPSLPGLQTSGSTHIIVEGAPEIRDPEATAMEEIVEKSVNLSCEAWGYPKPVITWSSTGAKNWREVSNRATDNSAHSVVTFTVTSDLTAACNATNDIGTDTKFFNIKAIPLTTSSSRVTVTVSPYPKKVKKEGSGVIIAVIIICILLLAILGSVLYFLYKKGKLPCGRSGKQDITTEKSSKDDIIMEMKSEKSEEAVLLQGINGDKKPPNDQ